MGENCGAPALKNQTNNGTLNNIEYLLIDGTAPLGHLPFWLGELAKFTLLYVIAWIGGILVDRWNVRVNYTRKINHFALFFLPVFVVNRFDYEPTLVTTAISSCLLLIFIGTFARPIRSRIPTLATMFGSFDRPEDRPHTLLWLLTQIVAGYFVLIPFIVLFHAWETAELIYIPILINGIGDGLAEPVGVRFGKHAYQVRGLFVDRTYIRTLEGSACVFFSAILVVALFADSFTRVQFLAALVALPVLMTLAEAFAPHTWDTPFLFLTGGVTVTVIVYFL